MPMKKFARRESAPVSQEACHHFLRELGIVSQEEWSVWVSANGSALKRPRLPADPVREYGNPSFWADYGGQYPEGWTAFVRTFAGGERNRPDGALAPWARYASRYRVATGYRGIRFSGVGESSARGYSAAFGVFLAYSAFEACLKALGRKPGKDVILDTPVAQGVRDAMGGSFALSSDLNGSLAPRVNRFFSAAATDNSPEASDLVVPASAIRHLVAHGVFTPTAGGALTVKAVRALRQLGDAVLAHSVKLFQENASRDIRK